MADIVREIERKYEATGGDPRLPDLTGVAGVSTVRDEGGDTLDATYYDTAARRLAADGITLRRRTGGGDEGWHLKLPVEPGVRDEVRAPLADEVPRRLAGLVRSRVGDAELVPVVGILTDRAVHRLLGEDGEPLAEVSVDRVTARRRATGKTAEWTEVEVELAGAGDPALLDAVESALRRAGLRRSDSPSKLARALAETATAGDHVLGYIRAQVDAIGALDPAVRLDTHDSVHRMRVATRRLRSAFRSYSKVLDRAATDPVGEELKWLAGELGVDRDREVLTERIHARLAELDRTLVHGPVRGRLRTWSAARRQGSRSRLIAVLDGRRYRALLQSLDALLADPPLRPAANRPPDEVLPRAVNRDFERLAARVDEVLAMPPSRDRDLVMHESRKAAKRTRYAAETARPALGKPARVFAARMTEVQELLGDHQDGVVAREALREIAAQAHAAGESAFTYGVLHAREEARAAALEERLPGLWAEVSRPGLRSALAP